MSVTSEFVNELLHRAADGYERNANDDEIQSQQYFKQATDFAASADARRRNANELREHAGPRIAKAKSGPVAHE